MFYKEGGIAEWSHHWPEPNNHAVCLFQLNETKRETLRHPFNNNYRDIIALIFIFRCPNEGRDKEIASTN